MTAINVDSAKVKTFKTAETFYAWLAKNHAKEREIWIKIDAVLCWGWIDGVRKSLDDKSYLQRYSPRGARSIWSQINVDNVSRLILEGRMTEAGLKEVERAKADGRWSRAYPGGQGMTIPDDLKAAIDAEPRARAMLKTLNVQSPTPLFVKTL